MSNTGTFNGKTLAQRKLAYATLDQIMAHPEEWYQDNWRCESGMCFAGWAVTLSGGKFVNALADDSAYDEYLFAQKSDDPDHMYPIGENGEPVYSYDYEFVPFNPKVHDPKKYMISTESRAIRKLGLDVSEGEDAELFAGNNSLQDLQNFVREMFGPRPDSMPKPKALTVEGYLVLVSRAVFAHHNWRYGQAAFNVLYSVRPKLADATRGNHELDPFHNTDKNLQAFLSFVESNWNSPEYAEPNPDTEPE